MRRSADLSANHLAAKPLLERGGVALLLALMAGSAQAGQSADCTCRAKDVVAKEGETVCLTTPNGGKLALCQKVLNNTSWKFLPGSCSHWVTQAAPDGAERTKLESGRFEQPLDTSPTKPSEGLRRQEIIERL